MLPTGYTSPARRARGAARRAQWRRVRGISVKRIPGVPERVPVWPPLRRSLTQFMPPSLVRWREARAAKKDTSTYSEVPEGVNLERRKVDVLALAYTQSQARTLIPLVRELRARGREAELVVDSQGMALPVCRKESFTPSVLQTEDTWGTAHDRVEKAFARLSSLWKRYLGMGWEELTFRGVPIPRLMNDEWRMLADLSLHHASLRRYLWWTEMVMRAIEERSPKLVLVADEAMPFGAIAVRAAGAADIPSMCVIHGAMPDHPKHVSAKATRVAVNGELTKRLLLERGTEPERIAVTGLPQFDRLADPAGLDPEPVLRELGVAAGRPVVVHTMLSGQGVTSMDEVVAATAEVVDAANEMRRQAAFVFKRHPADTGNLLVARMGVNPEGAGIVLTLDAPTLRLLAGADVVVTQMSTTGQEAIMLGRPLVVVNLSGKPDTIPYVEYGAALGVYRPGELAQALRLALSDDATLAALAEGRERFIRDFAYKADGKATERVIGVIDELLEDHSPE